MSDPRAWQVGTSTAVFGRFDEEVIKECKEAGITALEVGLVERSLPAGNLEVKLKELSKKAEELGVRIWSIHLPFSQQLDISNPDETKRREALGHLFSILELGKTLKPVKAVIHPSFEPIDPLFREAHIEACRSSLSLLGKKAEELGMQLCVECLPRTCIGNSTAEMLRLIEGIPEIGVCCDTNHLLKDYTEDFIRAVGSRLQTIHASDYDRVDERHWLPGDGVNNWGEIIAAMVEVGYEGPFMFESKRGNDTISLRVLTDRWRKLLEENNY